MFNNNIEPQLGEWTNDPPQTASLLQTQPTSMPQYSYQVHQPTDTKIEETSKESPTNEGRRPFGYFKQRNKAMYNSSMNFTGNSLGLNSQDKQIGQQLKPAQKPISSNSTNKTTSNMHKTPTKFTGYNMKDPKQLTLPSFMQTTNQLQFNKFPAFSITTTNQPQSTLTISSSNEVEKQNSNETPLEKKQRELLEIKKQLDQLSKKFVYTVEKNQNSRIHLQNNNNNNNNNNNQHVKVNQLSKPPKSGCATQSVIVQSNNKPNYTVGFGGLEQTQDNTNKINNSANKYTLTVSEPTTYSQKIQQISKKDILPQKNYQYKSSPEYDLQNFVKSQPTTNYTTYGTTYLRQKPSKSLHQSTQNTEYGSHDKYHSTFTNFTSSLPQPTSYSAQKSDGNSEQVLFKKKRQPIIYENQQMDFKKSYNTDQPKKSTYIDNPHFSNQQQYTSTHVGMKKHEYLSHTVPSPIPQLKKFKISDFIIGKKMGKGQFAQVILSRHKQTGFVCGLKVMEKQKIKQEDYAGQIARQLSIQFYLNHRNIAPLYGYFEDQKTVYLLVEFCTGGQLLERLREERRMNEKDVSNIIKQVCQGVDYIHKQLIIHRDIKPQNMLFNFGTVKISDFGWAVYRGFGMRKTASGSPLYYPPEIVKGQSYDDKIDVWNIGMMTYQCILGKTPFRVYSQFDLGRIVSDDIKFPQYVDVSNEAKDFILKTMRKIGDDRMQIKQMLRHPFITKHQDLNINQTILEDIKKVLN